MKKTTLLSLLVCFALNDCAIAQSIDWLGVTRPPDLPTPALGSDAYGITVDDYGNVYTVGMLYQNDQVGATADFFTSEDGPFISLLAESNGMFLLKQNSGGEVLWVKVWEHGSPRDVAITSTGDVVVAGGFSETMDFDPNGGTEEVEYIGGGGGGLSGAGFVLKLNSSGDFLWVEDFQGNGGVHVWGFSIGSNDQIVTTGVFSGSVNLGELESSYMGIDGFVLCLDSDGGFLWNKLIYGINAHYGVGAKAVTVDNEENVVVTGSFKGHVRFNGLENMALLTSSGSGPLGSPTSNPDLDVFILKLSPTGDFLWVRKSGNVGGAGAWEDNTAFAVAVDSQGNVYTTGSFKGVTSFGGISMGNTHDVSPLPERIFLCKHDADGDVIWAKEFGVGVGWAVDVDASGNVAFAGNFGCCPVSTEPTDFDPGLGSHELVSAGHRDGFVCRIDNAGNLMWVDQFGYEDSDIVRGIAVKNYTVYATGYMAVPVEQFDWPHGTMFNVKFYPEEECATFNAVITEAESVSCNQLGEVSVLAYGGMEPYSYLWNTQPPQTTSTALAAGPVTVTVTDEAGCQRSRTVMLSGPVGALLGAIDLNANIVVNFGSPGPTIPGGPFCTTTGIILVDAFNNGCVPANGALEVSTGDYMTLISSDPPPSSVSGNSFTWNLTDFGFESGHFIPAVTFQIDLTVPPSAETCIAVSITPLEEDLYPHNNQKEQCFPIFCSYDPNDKIVHPQGIGEEGFIEPNQTMTYTVRFQNTGTAPAFNIFILDTIDANLDISSFRVVGQSHHPMITELEPGNVIRFRFDNIFLPDSASNEPESHGYVIYEIDQMHDLGPGDQMLNTAYIYFDFNEPIQTNTVVNTIPFPVGIASITSEDLGLLVYPNPTDDVLEIRSNSPLMSIKVIDPLGRMIFDKTVNADRYTLQTGSWSAGIYLVDAIGKNGRTSVRFMKQ